MIVRKPNGDDDDDDDDDHRWQTRRDFVTTAQVEGKK
jgi:hypothetical protein